MNKMKKTLFLAALVLISAGCFAQKANVRKAKNLAMSSESPDFAAARAAIGEALENDETKDLTETWFTAGLIGYYQYDQARTMRMMGQPIDEETVGAAVLESYKYWLHADELAMVPVYDKKGNPKFDLKTRKQIAQKMQTYYDMQALISYGIYKNEQKDYAGAYEAFVAHLNIPDLPMIDEKMRQKMPKDTTYEQYQYYAAIFAIQAEMHPEAIALLEDLKNGQFETVSCNQFLYQEYLNEKDTLQAVALLKEAVVRFPAEPWFLQNLINHYIFSGQEQEAVTYLTEAIEREPNVAEYHHIRGNLNESLGRYEAALADFDNALRVDPKLADAAAGKGRVYYNQAVKVNEDAANIQDAKEYKKALEQMNDLFRQSLPFFEEAHRMDPENRTYMITLRTIYYRFNMTAEYEAIQAELNQ